MALVIEYVVVLLAFEDVAEIKAKESKQSFSKKTRVRTWRRYLASKSGIHALCRGFSTA